MLTVELHIFKDGIVRQEAYQGAFFAGIAHTLQRPLGNAGRYLAQLLIPLGGEAHAPVGPIPVDVHGQPLGQGVYHGCANAVEAAGVAVVLIVKLAAGMEFGINHFHAGYSQGRVSIYRHTSAIVIYAGRTVLMQCNVNPVCKAIGSLVNGVVHNFPQQVMEPSGRGCANVHAGTHTDCIQTFQHLNITCIVYLGHASDSPYGQFCCASHRSATSYFNIFSRRSQVFGRMFLLKDVKDTLHEPPQLKQNARKSLTSLN